MPRVFDNRNVYYTEMAAEKHQYLPQGSTVQSFDLDLSTWNAPLHRKDRERVDIG